MLPPTVVNTAVFVRKHRAVWPKNNAALKAEPGLGQLRLGHLRAGVAASAVVKVQLVFDFGAKRLRPAFALTARSALGGL
jgi:nucleoside recognition membrane protein YjiH